ncbi:hypothetical protein [Protofrankia symbiont of Coriaria ruscifolia]|uniref:Uncharacterized protein n=1 Tax=Candidatus Protofrankia californiensis TaxID=1839754 RepID=A0A1C3P0S1_9ACTN|nr:hypothetical protein [Protofrankia symbiont of Coriaria ruscifolia]SBW23419.1 hypothetical protein FDG2_3769 [Candidatus Protofrankia californiensis]
MANPRQPTIRLSVRGPTATSAQRAVNHFEPGERLPTGGMFGPKTDVAVKM